MSPALVKTIIKNGSGYYLNKPYDEVLGAAQLSKHVRTCKNMKEST